MGLLHSYGTIQIAPNYKIHFLTYTIAPFSPPIT